MAGGDVHKSFIYVCNITKPYLIGHGSASVQARVWHMSWIVQHTVAFLYRCSSINQPLQSSLMAWHQRLRLVLPMPDCLHQKSPAIIVHCHDGARIAVHCSDRSL